MHAVFQLIVIHKMASSQYMLQGLKRCKLEGAKSGLRRMRENRPLHCSSCLPYSQSGVWSGAVMQEEDLIHLPV